MAVSGFVSRTKTRSGFDPILARVQLETLRELYSSLGADAFYRSFICILRKKEEGTAEPTGAWNRRLVPYCMNRMQLDMRDTFGSSMSWGDTSGPKRNITLKWRQGGSTTHHIIDRLYVPTILNPGTISLLISQTSKYATKHLAILKRAHKHFGRANPFLVDTSANAMDDFHAHLLHTQYHDKHSLAFDFLDSQVMIESAENEEAGQGVTLHRVVGSETSRWPGNPEETLANLKEAVVPGGTIDIECTPNGMGGYFYDEWERARSWPGAEFRPHFYPWWWAEDCVEEPKMTEEELTEQERDLAKLVGLTLKNIQWRRTKIISLRHNFFEKYPEDDISAFLTSGRPFFDVEVLRSLKVSLAKTEPLEVHGNGDYLVYKRRIPNRRYIIGADPRAGELISEDKQDFNAAVVMDMDTAEEVASYRSRVPPEEFGYELADIGASYNNALICVERNNSGGSVILTLERQLLYGNIYYHKEWYRDAQGQRKVIALAGFPTNVKTRPMALNELAKLVRDGPELWKDRVFVDEALTFIYNDKGKPEHQPSKWDDTVLARAICSACRLVALGYFDPLQAGSQAYGHDDESEEAA